MKNSLCLKGHFRDENSQLETRIYGRAYYANEWIFSHINHGALERHKREYLRTNTNISQRNRFKLHVFDIKSIYSLFVGLHLQ